MENRKGIVESGHLSFSPLTVESGPLWETINFCVYPISRAACALLYTNIMPARPVFEISFSAWMLYGKTRKKKKELDKTCRQRLSRIQRHPTLNGLQFLYVRKAGDAGMVVG